MGRGGGKYFLNTRLFWTLEELEEGSGVVLPDTVLDVLVLPVVGLVAFLLPLRPGV